MHYYLIFAYERKSMHNVHVYLKSKAPYNKKKSTVKENEINDIRDASALTR